MVTDLPEPIAAYFSADNSSSAAVSGCFTPDAVVKDEGHTYRGIAEIEQWKARSSSQYNYTSEPTSWEEADGKIVVTCHVAGNFPGSPIDLRYLFELAGDRISVLEIGV